MIGKEKLLKKLESVLAHSTADQTEIVYVGDEFGLTRFANSFIHQNVYENNCRILFRTVLGKRVGVASTNSLVDADLKQTLDNSIEIARSRAENPKFPGLPKAGKYKQLATFDKATARCTPMLRAKTVQKVIAEATKQGFTMAGAYSTSSGEIAIVSSRGVRAYQPVTAASINMVTMSDTSSGYASAVSRRTSDIDFKALAKTAVDKCKLSQNPQALEPGEYEVILEPAAVAEVVEWLNYTGFGSKSFQQGTSFLASRIGRKITSEKITIYDNALDPKAIAFPFDFEGVPKKKVMLIDKGVAKGVVYDSMAAIKGKTKSTGHALPATEAAEGALGLNIVVAPGKTPRAKMISGVKRGILVTRFHYINGLIDTRNSVLTGMTRDGTFLIENGELKYGIKNLRFTDSMMRAFKSTVAISKESQLIAAWWSSVGCVSVPTIHLGSFKFSGKTEF
ncbi:MAG: TldD/PmbA family protein [candidate division Zixibacteria bacterium]|nr:TldD/PmbA family protein [candidate division Zixibacteria bacterium]